MNPNLGTPPSLERGAAIVPVETSDIPKLPWRMENGVVEAVGGCLESGQARGTSRRSIISSLLAVILISGCTAASSLAPLPANHPASTFAPEASPPPPSQAFSSESAAWAAPAEEAPEQKPQARHGAMHGGH